MDPLQTGTFFLFQPAVNGLAGRKMRPASGVLWKIKEGVKHWLFVHPVERLPALVADSPDQCAPCDAPRKSDGEKFLFFDWGDGPDPKKATVVNVYSYLVLAATGFPFFFDEINCVHTYGRNRHTYGRNRHACQLDSLLKNMICLEIVWRKGTRYLEFWNIYILSKCNLILPSL